MSLHLTPSQKKIARELIRENRQKYFDENEELERAKLDEACRAFDAVNVSLSNPDVFPSQRPDRNAAWEVYKDAMAEFDKWDSENNPARITGAAKLRRKMSLGNKKKNRLIQKLKTKMIDKPGLIDVIIDNIPKQKVFGDWLHTGALVLYKGELCLVIDQLSARSKFCSLMLNGTVQKVRKDGLRIVAED